jgi:4-alpha-glucanotransferase
MHVVVTRHGYSIDPTERELYSAQFTFTRSKRRKLVHHATASTVSLSDTCRFEQIQEESVQENKKSSHWQHRTRRRVSEGTTLTHHDGVLFIRSLSCRKRTKI